MDFQKLADREKTVLCKKYFFIGLACLPLVWLINFICFFKDAFLKPRTPEVLQIRTYVIMSFIGCAIWLVILSAWETVFQIFRVRGLPWTDALTFTFPLGRV
ncbi:unnamed protein product, partial [Mesorhabditis spiculigera]